jgi:hypothetical protein
LTGYILVTGLLKHESPVGTGIVTLSLSSGP